MKWIDFKYDVLYNKFYKGCSKYFAKYDMWNLNNEMVDWLLYRILILMKDRHGYPAYEMSEEAIKRGILTEEECKNGTNRTFKILDDLWQEELWEIAKGLASYRCIYDRSKRFYNGKPRLKELSKWENVCRKRFDQSMKLIIKYFDGLWD